MHDVTGLSWGLTIPLATVCLRIFGVSWIQYWTNHENRKLAIVQPYLSAYSQEMGRRRLEVGEERLQIKSALGLWRQNILVRFGVSPWRAALLPLLQLPIWWTFVETLRSMAGAPYGILGMMLRGLHLVDPTSEGGIAGRSVLLPQLVETSMASEGMLWFTDLTIPDPSCGLSVILAVVTYANIYLSRGPVTDQKYIALTRGRRQMQWIRKGMKFLPVALVPMTMYLPAATLLYWTSSAVSGLGVNLLLRKYRPIRKAVVPCTRGMDHLAPPPLWLNELVKKHR
jgi:inner membrane protein COX18